MASILEMTVKYLELVQQLVPLQKEFTVSAPAVKHTVDVDSKRKQVKCRKKKGKRRPSAGEQLLNSTIPTEVPEHVAESSEVYPVSHSKAESDGVLPLNHVFQEENGNYKSFSGSSHLTLQDDHAPSIELNIPKASRCSIPFCDTHNHFGVLATPPQQSPLLSSTSHQWQIQPFGTSKGSLQSSTPLPAFRRPSADEQNSPNGSLQAQSDVQDVLPFLTCSSPTDWIYEQENIHFKHLKGDDQLSSDNLGLFPSATQKNVPEINALDFEPEDPAHPLLQELQGPADGFMETWQPSSSLDLVYQEDLDMSFPDFFI